MINDLGIKTYLEESVGVHPETYSYFYGMKTASKGKMLLLGNLSALASKYYIVALNQDQMILINMSGMGKLKDFQILKQEDIEEINVKSWLFGMGQRNDIVFSDGSKIVLRANKKNLSIKEQSKGLDRMKSFK